MDIDAPKQKIGKFMRILSSIRKKLPDRRTFLIYKSNFYNLTKLGMILGLVVFLFCALIFVGLPAAIWADVHRDFRSFVRFEYGNGKETILLIEPEDKISLIESQLRDKLNVSSKYVVDLFVGDYKLDLEKSLYDYKLMKISQNQASPIPIINVRLSCPECPETEQVIANSDSKLLSRMDAIEKLLMKYIRINEKSNSRIKKN